MDTSTIEASDADQAGTRPGPSGAYIVGGTHAGAVIRVAKDDALLIGASDDCDVILTDKEVAAHHCMLALKGEKLAFRPIDATVQANGRRFSPGETAAVAVGERVELGSAVLEIVSGADIAARRPQAGFRPTSRRRSPVERLLRQSRWGIAAVLAVAVACEIHPVGRGAGASTQQSAAGSTSSQTDDAALAGTAVAHDVAEVLRLSGISGESRYEGDGTVTVKGHLGDPKVLATAVQSRAMREITGLKRVTVVNLDQAGTRAASGDSTWIVTAVASQDPYVIASDGSRYYVGATLPRGGRLAGVQDGEILVERDGQVDHVRLTPARPGG
jgi:hypothetical protein